ncbi:hypothetical protein CYMTET_31640, partial [Cymbomonas tetramitiformis]
AVKYAISDVLQKLLSGGDDWFSCGFCAIQRLLPEDQPPELLSQPSGLTHGGSETSEWLERWVDKLKLWVIVTIHRHGHRVCAIMLVIIAIVYPAFSTAVLLLAGMHALLCSDGRAFSRFAPYIFNYCLVVLLVNYAYNIPIRPSSLLPSPPPPPLPPPWPPPSPPPPPFFSDWRVWVDKAGFHLFDVHFASSLGCMFIISSVALAPYLRTIAAVTADPDRLVTAELALTNDLAALNQAQLLRMLQRSSFHAVCLWVYVLSFFNFSLLCSAFLLLALYGFAFPHEAKRCWLVYVLYSQAVLLLLFCWQFVPNQEDFLSPYYQHLIGLRSRTRRSMLQMRWDGEINQFELWSTTWPLVVNLLVVSVQYTSMRTSEERGQGQHIAESAEEDFHSLDLNEDEEDYHSVGTAMGTDDDAADLLLPAL